MITLGEYMSFIFKEITRARQYADATSIDIAKSYAKDDLLKHFSIPRFKIPEMELTVPVLIADVNYDNEYLYSITDVEFINKFNNELDRSFNGVFKDRDGLKHSENELLMDLYKIISNIVLSKSIDSYDDMLKQVTTMLEQKLDAIITKILSDNDVLKEYETRFPKKQHYIDLIEKFKKFVLFNIKIGKSTLTNLLINPETSIINESANEMSIFQIKAKITEEGIFVNSMKDQNGKEIFSVNFE